MQIYLGLSRTFDSLYYHNVTRETQIFVIATYNGWFLTSRHFHWRYHKHFRHDRTSVFGISCDGVVVETRDSLALMSATSGQRWYFCLPFYSVSFPPIPGAPLPLVGSIYVSRPCEVQVASFIAFEIVGTRCSYCFSSKSMVIFHALPPKLLPLSKLMAYSRVQSYPDIADSFNDLSRSSIGSLNDRQVHQCKISRGIL
jgi:hypothetical protein